MKKEARRFGLDAPFLRPKELSTDDANVIDVWKHALLQSEKYYGQSFDITVLLEPSSPLRNSEDIIQTIDKLILGNYDSVLTISETDSKSHPLKQLDIKNDKIKNYDKNGRRITARQQLKPLYHRNGVAYAITKRCLIEKGEIITTNSSFFIIEHETINIDTMSDFKYAQFLFEM